MYRGNIQAFLVKNDLDQAVALYRESISIDPKRWQAFFFLGKTLIAQGNYVAAEQELQAAANLVPDNDAVKSELETAQIRQTLALNADGSAPVLPDDPQLTAALKKSVEEHEKEVAESCSKFYCGPSARSEEARAFKAPLMDKYSMGRVPSNDFPAAFAGEAEQIFVTAQPLFSADECQEVIDLAEAEGGGLPATKSGKYQIGRAWIKDMPQVLSWFNEALQARLFPTLAALFPSLVSGVPMLRAHSVLVVKYNASDTTPRSDVHVDDALLAFTIALSPTSAYEGGGTYFEHLNATSPHFRDRTQATCHRHRLSSPQPTAAPACHRHRLPTLPPVSTALASTASDGTAARLCVCLCICLCVCLWAHFVCGVARCFTCGRCSRYAAGARDLPAGLSTPCGCCHHLWCPIHHRRLHRA